MPIENLVIDELPDCQSGYRPATYNDATIFDSGSANDLSIWPPTPSRFNTNSPYVALGVAGVIILVVVIILVAK